MNFKYVLHPGNVKSTTDGQIHHIGYGQLAELYKVNINKCISADNRGYKYSIKNTEKDKELIHLYPDGLGKYKILGNCYTCRQTIIREEKYYCNMVGNLRFIEEDKLDIVCPLWVDKTTKIDKPSKSDNEPINKSLLEETRDILEGL